MCIQRHYAHGVAGFSWNIHYRGIANSRQACAFDVPAHVPAHVAAHHAVSRGLGDPPSPNMPNEGA